MIQYIVQIFKVASVWQIGFGVGNIDKDFEPVDA